MLVFAFSILQACDSPSPDRVLRFPLHSSLHPNRIPSSTLNLRIARTSRTTIVFPNASNPDIFCTSHPETALVQLWSISVTLFRKRGDVLFCPAGERSYRLQNMRGFNCSCIVLFSHDSETLITYAPYCDSCSCSLPHYYLE